MKKAQNLSFVSFNNVKNQFAKFEDLKFLFSIFWRFIFKVIGRYLKIFRNKYSFLRSLWFLENENFAARAAKFARFFGIGLIKHIPDRQHMHCSARFRKSQKVLYHSTLLGMYFCTIVCPFVMAAPGILTKTAKTIFITCRSYRLSHILNFIMRFIPVCLFNSVP